MPDKSITDLLELTENTMRAEIKKKSSGLSMEEAMRAIMETDEYLFLTFHGDIDSEQYVINFIRFIGVYTADPEQIARTFKILISNIRRARGLLLDPTIQFMANSSKHNLIMGFLVEPDK